MSANLAVAHLQLGTADLQIDLRVPGAGGGALSDLERALRALWDGYLAQEAMAPVAASDLGRALPFPPLSASPADDPYDHQVMTPAATKS